MGKVLKKIEEEWIKNNFKITKNQVQEIIIDYTLTKYIQRLISQSFFHRMEY